MAALKFVKMTQLEWLAATPDPDTLYFVLNGGIANAYITNAAGDPKIIDSSGAVVSPSAEMTRLVEYDSAFVLGQVVYIDDDVAYPVTRAMPESALNLLGVVRVAGPGGTVERVVTAGFVGAPAYALSPGPVYLDDAGFPTSVDNPVANYVPLGYAATAVAFHLSPLPRYFRS